MTTVRFSGATSKNPGVEDWSKAYRDQGNLEFFAAALGALSERKVGNEGLMVIGLVGQRDIPGVALRRAQSVLRWDLRPSLWSHAFLIVERTTASPAPAQLKDLSTLEVTLHPRTGQFPEPANNGVIGGRLGLYAEPKVDANVALLGVHMNDSQAETVADRARNPNRDRLRYNLWETLGIWQGYLWSHGARPNPLREGIPIFSSAFVEYAFEAIGVDITPGASERNSAPEHIWNAAVWWEEAFRDNDHPVSGFFVLRDLCCCLLDPEEQTGSLP
jgi:hypothetical protein